jgi:hypothetical protein
MSDNIVNPAPDFRALVSEDGSKFAEGWTEKLPESHKPYAASLSKFPTPFDALASYAQLEKKLGEKIQPPGPDAKPEDWDRWRGVIGAPMKPEDYGLKAPEKLPEGVQWDDGLAGKFASIGHKHAIPKAALAEFAQLHLEHSAASVAAEKAAADAYIEKQTGELKTEWGADYDKNLALSVKAAEKLGLDINDPAYGSDAKQIKLLFKAAALMREDQMLGGIEGSKQSAAEQIAEIRKSDAYQGKSGTEAQTEAARRIALLSGVKA